MLERVYGFLPGFFGERNGDVCFLFHAEDGVLARVNAGMVGNRRGLLRAVFATLPSSSTVISALFTVSLPTQTIESAAFSVPSPTVRTMTWPPSWPRRSVVLETSSPRELSSFE
jgi:hypothetical protein